MANPKLPGIPGPPNEAIQRQEAITTAFASMHAALSPLLEWIPGRNTAIQLTRTVCGHKVTVTLQPGDER